jgi:predicted ATP-dependent Lon-type protease
MTKEDAKLLLELAIELRLRVLLQLNIINKQEFPLTELHYIDKESNECIPVRIIGEGKIEADAW